MKNFLKRPRPVWLYLIGLAIALTLPILAVSAYMTWNFAQSERTRLENAVAEVNEQIVYALERQQVSEIAMLRVLATSPALHQSDFAAFRRQVAVIVQSDLPYADIVLRGLDGKVILNTGTAPLPANLARAGIAPPTISDLARGDSFLGSAYYVSVPVLVDSAIRYYLLARLPLQRLVTLIQEQTVDPGYFASIVDADCVILARSAESEKHFGQSMNGVNRSSPANFSWSGDNPQGVPVYGIFSRSKLSSWGVTTGVSQKVLHAPLNRLLLWLSGLTVAIFGLGWLIAYSLSRVLAAAARTIIATAVDLGEGKEVQPFVTPVSDANVIGNALKAASDKLRQQADALVSAKKTLERRVEERTEELAAKTRLLETTLASMDEGLIVIDKSGFIKLHNPQAAELFDLPPAMLAAGPNIADTVAFQKRRGDFKETPEDLKIVFSRDAIVAGNAMLHERERPNGQVVEVRTVPMDDGALLRTYTDVTLRKHAERHLQHLARHDSLTQLPNRLHFREYLEQAIAYGRRHDAPFSVMFIDIDHFKTINDVHGHGVGDALLMEVAARFKSALRMEDTVARLGGDEFAVLQAGSGESDGPAVLARRLLKSVSQTLRIDNINVNISISIGIARCPEGDISADEIMRRADTALYQAKRSGRDRFCEFEEIREILRAG